MTFAQESTVKLPIVYDATQTPTGEDLQAFAEFLRHASERSEKDLQFLFEGHPSLIGILGYSGFISEHPLFKADAENRPLLSDNRRRDRADFIAAKQSPACPSYLSSHLIELKRANLDLAERAQGFRLTDHAAAAIGQLKEYYHWLTTIPANRSILSNLRWDVRRPTLTLVMGRDAEFVHNPGQLEEIKAYVLEQGISLFTLDDILHAAERHCHAPPVRLPLTMWSAPQGIHHDSIPSLQLWLSSCYPDLSPGSHLPPFRPSSQSYRLGIITTGISLRHPAIASRPPIDLQFARFSRSGQMIDTTPVDLDPQEHGTSLALRVLEMHPTARLSIAAALDHEGGNSSAFLAALEWLLSDDTTAIIALPLQFVDPPSQGMWLLLNDVMTRIVTKFNVPIFVPIGRDGPGNINMLASLNGVHSVGLADQIGSFWQENSHANAGGMFKPDYFAPAAIDSPIPGVELDSAAPCALLSAAALWGIENGFEPREFLARCGRRCHVGFGAYAGFSVHIDIGSIRAWQKRTDAR